MVAVAGELLLQPHPHVWNVIQPLELHRGVLHRQDRLGCLECLCVRCVRCVCVCGCDVCVRVCGCMCACVHVYMCVRGVRVCIFFPFSVRGFIVQGYLRGSLPRLFSPLEVMMKKQTERLLLILN